MKYTLESMNIKTPRDLMTEISRCQAKISEASSSVDYFGGLAMEAQLAGDKAKEVKYAGIQFRHLQLLAKYRDIFDNVLQPAYSGGVVTMNDHGAIPAVFGQSQPAFQISE